MNQPDYFDIHTHLNFTAFDEDRGEVIDRALEAGVWFNNVGTQQDTSRQAVEIAESRPEGVYATVGLHPIHTTASFHDEQELGAGGTEFTSRGEEIDTEYYRRLAQHEKVVAIGETGLDYFHLDEEATRSAQKQAFEAQIALAHSLEKPLMLHIRNGKNGEDAYGEVLDILEHTPHSGGNAHFFAGDRDQIRRFLEQGFCISFTGVVTFTEDYNELVRYVPLDRLMAETDAPFVAPKGRRGRRNEPLLVREIAEQIVKLRPEPDAEVRSALVENACRLFSSAFLLN